MARKKMIFEISSIMIAPIYHCQVDLLLRILFYGTRETTLQTGYPDRLGGYECADFDVERKLIELE